MQKPATSAADTLPASPPDIARQQNALPCIQAEVTRTQSHQESIDKMKSFLASLLLVVASPVFADNGFSWDVRPGPNGTIRVSTSAGTYIVDIDGNSGWVGTEQEYEARRIGGVLRSDGFHEMKIKGQSPNIHQVVSNNLPSTAVGSTNVGDINTTIYFGTTPDKKLHRPPKQADSEYVGSVWTQSLFTISSIAEPKTPMKQTASWY
ncbi:MAG: hypothetical protein P4L91_21085 [Burkholderiaceae bacterium]|nr:hypothetical protein [Burkholderiaceae bacterium]